MKDGNEEARKLLKHNDPIVRANAARVLGATEDKQAFDALLDRALHDADERVGVSAIRALGSLKDARASEPLFKRASQALGVLRAKSVEPMVQNELLEIMAAFARVNPQLGSGPQARDERYTRALFSNLREVIYPWAPEIEVAYARVAPGDYVTDAGHLAAVKGMQKARARQVSSVAQALSVIAGLKLETDQKTSEMKKRAELTLARGLCAAAGAATNCVRAPTLAIPEVLRAYAAFKPTALPQVLLQYLKGDDVIVRATAAELLGEQPQSDVNTRALIDALPRAMRDRDLNDAALAVLDALKKKKNKQANDAIKTALNSSDHLLRRKAVELLKANGVGDFSDRIGTVKTRNTLVDYRRAISRMGKKVTATIVTNKGPFTIEFLPDQAPLTVDNFIQLARRRYFNGQTIPRVVPNFVVQAGDPRGDQNGGPGYQIRCEINEVPYERAAVGMALSGKDTGGSQWFVTHSPQPHLDGGYTVFGRVISGMDVVDRIARGDVIRRVVINER